MSQQVNCTTVRGRMRWPDRMRAGTADVSVKVDPAAVAAAFASKSDPQRHTGVYPAFQGPLMARDQNDGLNHKVSKR